MHINILMPVFNEEKFIEEAISSVISFDYPEGISIKLIIVDDFSTDSTASVAKTFQNRYPDIIYFSKNTKKGKNSAFNLAHTLSDDGLTCLLGGDDKLDPNTLLRRASAIIDWKADNPLDQRIASACKIKTFSNESKYDSIIIPKTVGKGQISGGSIMLDATLTSEIFPLPENLPNEDSWIALHLKYKNVKIIHVPAIGLHYRIHPGNSHKRGIDFNSFNTAMWKRSRASLIFYSRYFDTLTTKEEQKIVLEIFIECGKFLKESLAIFLVSNLSVKEKIKAMTYSSRAGYYIKQRFYNFFAGK